ncbi:MAG: hypothetical protein LBV46_02645, partial [Bacteroidales bacterium]|nr:hypothetical protein [Bacteroidales bacterium]
MKKSIIVLFLLIFPYFIKSQNITKHISTINVEISAFDILDSAKVISLCGELIHVRQIFYLQNQKNDTLHLYLEHPSGWAVLNSSLFFQKMEVNVVNGEKKEPLPFLFPGTELSFCAPEENCTVEIGYYYMMPLYNLSTPYSFLSY